MKNIEDKNISDFHKGREIANSIIGVLQNRPDHSENDDQLQDFIVSNKYSSETLDTLTNYEKISKICSEYNRQNKLDEAKALEAILSNRGNNNRRHKLVLLMTSVAASVTLFFVFLSFDWQPTPQFQEIATINVAPKPDLAVPMLVLSSGKQVKLSEIISHDSIEKNENIDRLANNIPVDYSDSINKIIIPNKFTYTVTLEDGTKVLLNANSEFRYPVSFKKDRREVFLKGEGYFQVSKSTIPFIVNTEDISVKVYGTEFNINTGNDELIETILVEGSVGVTVKGGKEVMMTPNQMFTFNSTSGEETIQDVDPDNHLGWVNDLFKCQNEKLSVVLDRMSMWYDVQFNYPKEEYKEILVTIRISRSTDLDDILKALEVITDHKFIKKTPNSYVVDDL